MSSFVSTDPWVWVAALLTLGIFSFLYRENPFYRFVEHLFVGVSAGYGVAIVWNNGVVPNLIDPLRTDPTAMGKFLVLIPGLLGLLFFFRFVPRRGYLILLPLAVYMGAANGMAIPPTIQADIIKQMQGTIGDATNLQLGTLNFLSGLFASIGVIATLTYFFFSREHKGPLRVSATVGIWFIMIGFGASFGNTVMARVSLLIGRVQFLLTDWLHLIK